MYSCTNLWLYVLLSCTHLIHFCKPHNNNTLLLIISFDGFRFNYFDRNISNTLIGLRNNGSYPPYMSSVFPSKTFPNHFSIATGLYTEIHGVLDNKIYDSLTNKTLGYGYDLFHFNEDVVPIWTLNEKGGGGRRSGCMMYPGSNFEYQNSLPSHYMPYNQSESWEDRIDTLLSWFQHPETPINFGIAYFEQPDLICHSYGPDSEQVNKEIKHVDQIVKYLLNKTSEGGLLERLNIVLLSDHGGQAVKVPENMIDLDHFINKSLYIRNGIPPNLQIYPLKGKEEEVLRTLRAARAKGGNFSTFARAEMLDRWHYRDCARTPPILVAADLGFLFTTNQNVTYNTSFIGTHGYDPVYDSMKGFFIATGPAFKRNHTVEPFENINVYPLAAHILGLSLPQLRPNGSLLNIQDVLAEDITVEEMGNSYVEKMDNSSFIVAGMAIAAVCLVLVIGLVVVRRKIVHRQDRARRSTTATYKVLNQGNDEERLFEHREFLMSDFEDDLLT